MRSDTALYDLVQHRCVSTGESVSKLWYIQAVQYYVMVHKSGVHLYVLIRKDIYF